MLGLHPVGEAGIEPPASQFRFQPRQPHRGGRTGAHRQSGAGNDAILDLQHQADHRSEEHTSELQSLMRISYAVFCLKKKKKKNKRKNKTRQIHKSKSEYQATTQSS